MRTFVLALAAIILFLFLAPFSGFSQLTKVVSGYYIDISGDTTYGEFPAYKNWDLSPSEVDFRPVNTDKNIVLTTANCRSFYIDNYDTYLAYSGTTLINPTGLNNNYQAMDTEDKAIKVNTFLRMIFSNKDFKLFSLNLKERNTFFYQEKSGPVTELLYKNYMSNTSMKLIEMLAYKNQLMILFEKQITQNRLSGKLEKLQYKEESLINFMEKIFNTSHQKTQLKYRSSFFITAGISISSLKTSGDESVPEVNTKYNQSYSPVLSLGAHIPFQRNFGGFFISTVLKAYSFNHKGVADKHSAYNYQTITTSFKSTCLSALVFFGYSPVRTKLIEWNIMAGPGLLYLAGYTRTIQKDNYPTESVKENIYGLNPNFQTNLIFNKNIMLCFNYNFPVSPTYSGYSTSHSSMQFSAGWRFNKK